MQTASVCQNQGTRSTHLTFSLTFSLATFQEYPNTNQVVAGVKHSIGL